MFKKKKVVIIFSIICIQLAFQLNNWYRTNNFYLNNFTKLFLLAKNINEIDINTLKKDDSNNKDKNIIIKLEDKIEKT